MYRIMYLRTYLLICVNPLIMCLLIVNMYLCIYLFASMLINLSIVHPRGRRRPCRGSSGRGAPRRPITVTTMSITTAAATTTTTATTATTTTTTTTSYY